MAACPYCGQKTNWFSDVHLRCIELAQRGYSFLVAEVASAVSTDKPFSEVRPTLERITSKHRVPGDEVQKAVKQGWANAAAQIGLTEPLSMERHSVMMHFYEAAGISGKELASTDGFKTAVSSMMLWFLLTGKPMAAEHPHPFNLDRDEIPLSFFGSVVYSHKTGTRSYGRINPGESVSFGLGRYYPYSSFMAERADSKMLKEVDYGGMLVTTNNIYFGGEYKSFRIPHEQIVKLRPFIDSLEMCRDTVDARSEVFTVANAWPGCGWFLFNLTHFLAQPEARALYGKRSKSDSSFGSPLQTTNYVSSPQAKRWDVFISHASEDKDDFVRPLVVALTNANISVWYDEFSLKVGDSLRRSIDHGLSNSRYGIVVLSKKFFEKHWPTQELNGLATREVGENKVILPIWHQVTFEEVRQFSPILADRLAANSSAGLDTVVQRILEVLGSKQ